VFRNSGGRGCNQNVHVICRISGDKKSLNMDYLPFMRHSLTEPMITNESEGVHEVIQLMDNYDIIKEDYDNILEISKWPNSRDPLKDLNSKVFMVTVL